MPKVKNLQTNFSAGELSPKAAGRVDISRYPNAARRMVNVVSRTLGQADKRDGTQYVAAAKNANKRARLIPYIVSQDEAYMLEFGDTYMRVFKPDGTAVGAPYEIATSYTEAQVAELDYSQSEGAMYLFHSDVYPNRLRTFAEDSWNCSAAPFTTTPFAEVGDFYAVALTLSSNTVGVGRTMAAVSAVFLAADVGRAILWNAGVAIITGYTDTQHVTVEVKSIFDAAAIPSGSWNLDSSPQTTLTPSAKDPVGSIISLTLAAAGWRTTDVGKFVALNNGLVKITAFSSTTIVNAKIIVELTAVTAVPALAWTLNASVWNAQFGYPRTGTMHEQRLVTASTKENPQTIWGSRIGEELDFTSGVNDDDAFSFTIGGNDNQVNQIGFIASERNLLALTFGGEYILTGGVEKPITPTNISVKIQSPHGVKDGVRPVQVGRETLFAQRAGRKLRAMGYDYQQDGYRSPDLATLAEHITETGIAGMAFQQEPDPIVWVWLNNGRLVSVTLDRDLDIVAWNRHEIDGGVESVAVMPSGDTEQVWLIIRRIVNGSTVRYIERMRHDWYPIYGTESPDWNAVPVADEPYSWGVQLDCAVTQDDAVGKQVWTGLTHLEGRVVRCIADGVDMGDFTVSSGQIDIGRNAKRVLIGLMFLPEIELLPPEIPVEGTSQASAFSTNSLSIRVYKTIGATINGEEVIPGRSIGPDQLDLSPTPFTGDKAASMVGWDIGKDEVIISQNAPVPFHLLAVIRSVTVNGG